MKNKPNLIDVPKHKLDLCNKWIAYDLEDLKKVATEIVCFDGNHWLVIVDDDDSIDYGLYSFLTATIAPEEGPTYVHCVWRGHGYSGSLREMRHTYFNPEDVDKDCIGYCFYLPLDATIAALQHLKKYFDD